MTIEIADRLIKLRKKHGYSQEELADKLGLSRQAVSKWERAEASPDTDNLICLAKLYGVSLDELLSTDEDIDTIVEEQVKRDEEPKEELKDTVVINSDGVVATDDEGQKVVIDEDGFKAYDKEGIIHHASKPSVVLGCVECSLFVLSIVAYILLGTLLGMWRSAWIVMLLPSIFCSIGRSIIKKNPQHFNVAFLSVFVFFFVCMILPGEEANLWHPMWVVFFAIPVYHTIVHAIRKAIAKQEDSDDVIENKEDDDDKD